jgi:Family of unknown function (DUF5681)
MRPLPFAVSPWHGVVRFREVMRNMCPGAICFGMDAENSGSNQRKQRGRPFRPGQSGNPQGKPRGVRNLATRLLDEMAEADAANVLTAVLSRAKDGDMTAAAMVMTRVWPARKGRPVTFDLPPLTTAADLAAALGSVAHAVGTGVLTPEEGQAVGALLDAQRRAVELTALEERVAALEGKLHGSTT